MSSGIKVSIHFVLQISLFILLIKGFQITINTRINKIIKIINIITLLVLCNLLELSNASIN